MGKPTSTKTNIDGEPIAERTEAGVIAALAQQAASKPSILKHGDRSYLVLPDGVTAKEVTNPNGLIQSPPPRIVQTPELFDKDSLVAYLSRHKIDSSVIFADPFSDVFLGVIDWHGAEEAAFLDHVVKLKLQRSEEWKRWSDISGKLMPQMDFARFLEENAADVENPTGADLLEVARDMSAKRNVQFRSAIRLQNGDESFEYIEETVASAQTAGKRGAVEVPNQFTLRIPVYMNEPSIPIQAFLRWKIVEGGLGIGIELHRPVFVQQAVFKQIGLDIASRVDLEVWTGKPGVNPASSI